MNINKNNNGNHYLLRRALREKCGKKPSPPALLLALSIYCQNEAKKKPSTEHMSTRICDFIIGNDQLIWDDRCPATDGLLQSSVTSWCLLQCALTISDSKDNNWVSFNTLDMLLICSCLLYEDMTHMKCLVPQLRRSYLNLVKAAILGKQPNTVEKITFNGVANMMNHISVVVFGINTSHVHDRSLSALKMMKHIFNFYFCHATGASRGCFIVPLLFMLPIWQHLKKKYPQKVMDFASYWLNKNHSVINNKQLDDVVSILYWDSFQTVLNALFGDGTTVLFVSFGHEKRTPLHRRVSYGLLRAFVLSGMVDRQGIHSRFIEYIQLDKRFTRNGVHISPFVQTIVDLHLQNDLSNVDSEIAVRSMRFFQKHGVFFDPTIYPQEKFIPQMILRATCPCCAVDAFKDIYEGTDIINHGVMIYSVHQPFCPNQTRVPKHKSEFADFLSDVPDVRSMNTQFVNVILSEKIRMLSPDIRSCEAEKAHSHESVMPLADIYTMLWYRWMAHEDTPEFSFVSKTLTAIITYLDKNRQFKMQHNDEKEQVTIDEIKRIESRIVELAGHNSKNKQDYNIHQLIAKIVTDAYQHVKEIFSVFYEAMDALKIYYKYLEPPKDMQEQVELAKNIADKFKEFIQLTKQQTDQHSTN
jgi:hypothetical protein